MTYTIKMWFRVRVSQASLGKPKTAWLLFDGRLVASAPFTFWGGIGKIRVYDEADFLTPGVRSKIQSFLREWGNSAVMSRLDYAKDQAELYKES